TEAIDAARRAGDDELASQGRECLVWGHLLRGERAAAMREWAALSRSGRRGAEGAGWTDLLDAVLAWADDAQRAYRSLWTVFERLSQEAQAFNAVARGVARMALRLDDRDGLARTTSAFLEVTAGSSGPMSQLRRRWFGGLVSDPDGTDVEAAAAELDAAGYRLLAAYAFADAAILAARAGRVSDANERAMTIADEIGLHPSLGPLPETRWDAAQASMGR
ncbi:MAG: hypothetical protein ABWY52_07340, partial [Candidatus Limnocylindrales bacterium]